LLNRTSRVPQIMNNHVILLFEILNLLLKLLCFLLTFKKVCIIFFDNYILIKNVFWPSLNELLKFFFFDDLFLCKIFLGLH
jgi:hypothetical protein